MFTNSAHSSKHAYISLISYLLHLNLAFKLIQFTQFMISYENYTSAFDTSLHLTGHIDLLCYVEIQYIPLFSVIAKYCFIFQIVVWNIWFTWAFNHWSVKNEWL